MSVTEQLSEQKRITFHHLLMATDFSPASQRALAYASAIAFRYGSELTIVHALLPEPHERIPLDPLPHALDRRRLEAEQQMNHLAEESQLQRLPHELLLERGNVWDVLAHKIQSSKTDLLVIGTRGRGGIKKLALGSVAEEILHLAPCAVFTVGPNVPPIGSSPPEFKRILFATDFLPGSEAAFPYALSLAEDYRAKLFLLHMVPPMPAADLGPAIYGPSSYAADELTKWQRRIRLESINRLKAMIPLENRLAVVPEFIVGMDFLPEGILSATAAHNIDLIVMGENRTSAPRMAAHIPWALMHDVLCHAKCPVLSVCR